MTPRDFFLKLRSTANQDLSRAHLDQHFDTAKRFVQAAGIDPTTLGTWSTNKPQDTLEYSDGYVQGFKHWVSGVDLCDWVVVAAKEKNAVVLIMISKNDLKIIPAPTMGMEGTLTVNFSCERSPAMKLFPKDDPKSDEVFKWHNFSFITNHLGLSESLLSDIREYTEKRFDYDVKKLRLKVDMFDMIWQRDLENFELIVNNWGPDSRTYALLKWYWEILSS